VPDIDELSVLLASARQMPVAMLPRPRTERRVIDLTASEVTIPATAAALMDGYDDYGS
jgi:hypothetical protein